ncbi:MAG: DNA topoisomerase I, partial [Nanoarchaeota archaeon]|nr:DNA topoisomerase I [Nanoarchaeota archaeon]
MYELIICEKPNAARKIAEALADDKPTKKSSKTRVPYYILTHDGKDIMVVSAVGHIYGLTQKQGILKSKYPVFDIEWQPSSKLKKGHFSSKYLAVIKKFAKDANEFTVATDYDVEGEVIGLNIIRYACKQKDANRMKFSTLTKNDLVKSYKNKSPSIDWGQANAGETRHIMDWFFGINLSRALTASIKAIGSFKLMSTGRVQGPALKLVVDKEKEIKAFIPVPYNTIELTGKKDKEDIFAIHEAGNIFDKEKANTLYNNCKTQKTAEVKDVTAKKFESQPPHPFDLTSLQIEAHKCLRISPKRTLEIAQELYTNGSTSYPRTSSQKLPKEIGYTKILKALSKLRDYKDSAEFLLKLKSLKPNEGKKDDPAHPAIYPTGERPKFKLDQEQKVYDLIVKRFMATFGDFAVRETITAKLDCNKEIFVTKGTRTVKEGWFALYRPYVMLQEQTLPKMEQGDPIKVLKIDKLDKQTLPPKRFTEASIIKALEKENLGTKATRASIIETLERRGYIEGKPLEATEIGIITEETLEKYSPDIVNPELTRNFEHQMDEIRQGTKESKDVIEEAKISVTKLVEKFNSHLKEIGTELQKANKKTQETQAHVGTCHKCGKGNLVIKKGRFGLFIACDQYPECKATFKLPSNALIKVTEHICKECDHPLVQVIRRGKRPQEMCIFPDCPSKNQLEEGETKKPTIKVNEKNEIGRKCPKCKSEL